ncbi:Mitochondrial inner membrane protease subunit 1 [Chionoecetes opilio]|uniref:Mitochondrial inner membrane protease subunit n=1 Tax=Chionoecetes opilio TaxID=41210 RepID=A0A8J5CKY3_CHIOP|nr:Mitochondrial inner membrane protease subunit 1 [Chionoecetes opilio]
MAVEEMTVDDDRGQSRWRTGQQRPKSCQRVFPEVPKGHVWLEGDNHHNSTDSRNFGSVPAGLIRGRAVFRVWPLSELGMLDSSSSPSPPASASSSGQKWEVDQ